MVEPIDGFVEANGIRLHHLKWMAGGHELPPLVLVHATGFLARLWQPVADLLTARFTVHAFDIRGHGDSDKPVEMPGEDPLAPDTESFAGDYHWQNLVDDLAALLDVLSLTGVPIAGHSSGGATAAYLAATRPEYVSSLVLIEPIIIPSQIAVEDNQKSRMADGARKRRQVWASVGEMIAAYRTRPTFEHWRDDVLRLYAEEGTYRREDGQIALKCPGEIEAQVFENSASLDVWDVLPRVDCPTAVMKGAWTERFLSMMATGAAERIPGARLVTIANAGHLAPMERPESVADEIMTFLSGGTGG